MCASLAVTALVFDARQWGVFIAANLMFAATYALLGVCLGPIFGGVSGVFVAFLVRFLDLGIGQSPSARSAESLGSPSRPESCRRIRRGPVEPEERRDEGIRISAVTGLCEALDRQLGDVLGDQP